MRGQVWIKKLDFFRKVQLLTALLALALTALASAAHSANVMSRIGTNGTTAAAPSRGCAPRCSNRLMR